MTKKNRQPDPPSENEIKRANARSAMEYLGYVEDSLRRLSSGAYLEDTQRLVSLRRRVDRMRKEIEKEWYDRYNRRCLYEKIDEREKERKEAHKGEFLEYDVEDKGEYLLVTPYYGAYGIDEMPENPEPYRVYMDWTWIEENQWTEEALADDTPGVNWRHRL